jgi:hypothetical protein
VVLDTPAFDQDLRLQKPLEDFTVEQFIPQLAIEALDVAVLPRAARFDVQRLYADLLQPLTHLLGGELRAVV